MTYKRVFVGNRMLHIEERLLSKEEKYQRFYKLIPYADANGWLRREDGEPMCLSDICQLFGCDLAQCRRWMKEIMGIRIEDQHLMCAAGHTLNKKEWTFSINPYLVWRDKPQKRMVFHVTL